MPHSVKSWWNSRQRSGEQGGSPVHPRSLKFGSPALRVMYSRWRRQGVSTLFRSVGIESDGTAKPGCLGSSDTGGLTYESVTLDKLGPVRVASRVIPGPSGPLLIQVAASMVPNARALQELVMILLSIGPLVLACGLGCGYWLARKALAPVDRMTATAAAITSTQLGPSSGRARNRG